MPSRKHPVGMTTFVTTLLIAASMTVAALAASGPASGSMPSQDECAAGERNGVHLGERVGSLTLCVGADGTAIVYAGGRFVLLPCGAVTAAGHDIIPGDPQGCDDFGPGGGATLRYRVQLPSDHDASTRRYPVLYLLPGGEGDEDRWHEMTDIASLADQGVIIVSVFNQNGFYNDWASGGLAFETLYTDVLVDVIDETYRTIPQRAYRAVAGVSEGGYGAMLFAARHPELYVAAASFSGPVDVMDPAFLALGSVLAANNAIGTYEEPVRTPYAMFGDPARHEVRWHGRNPMDLAGNLHGVFVWHAVGDGVPSVEDVFDVGPGIVPQATIERLGKRMNDHFHEALVDAGVPHTYVERPGIHTERYAIADLHAWFPLMLDAFGDDTPPQSFDHRSVDAEFDAWGWRFRADPARAEEFLFVTDASVSGLTLRGSGLTAVVTAPLFRSGATVLLQGATTSSAVADAMGALAFHVDLGEPHAYQQYTAEQRAAELAAGGAYFTTVSVAFTPCPGKAPSHACEMARR